MLHLGGMVPKRKVRHSFNATVCYHDEEVEDGIERKFMRHCHLQAIYQEYSDFRCTLKPFLASFRHILVSFLWYLLCYP